MNSMATAPAHAKPAPRNDHLWVLVIIAACAQLEVWGSWVTIGSMSGFPLLGHLRTDWTLAVVMEAYWGYALYAWLAGAPGPRSRRFAMWSAAAVFVLSLIGQALSHLTAGVHRAPPAAVVVFVTSLPVVILALIAILVHLRHLDRAAAAEVVADASAAGEIAALRAELEALTGTLETARVERDTAQRELAEALTRAEALAKKLAAKSAPKTRQRKRESAQSEDLTTELRALKLLDDEPALRQPGMGGELARKLGVSPATGRRWHARLTAQDRPADPLTERSAERPDERSGERS